MPSGRGRAHARASRTAMRPRRPSIAARVRSLFDGTPARPPGAGTPRRPGYSPPPGSHPCDSSPPRPAPTNHPPPADRALGSPQCSLYVAGKTCDGGRKGNHEPPAVRGLSALHRLHRRILNCALGYQSMTGRQRPIAVVSSIPPDRVDRAQVVSVAQATGSACAVVFRHRRANDLPERSLAPSSPATPAVQGVRAMIGAFPRPMGRTSARVAYRT